MAKTNGNVNNLDLLKEGGVTELVVAGETIVYSESFVNPKDTSFSFELKFTSLGNVRITVELEQGNIAPATEGVIDANMVVAEDAPDILTALTTTAVKLIPHAPTVANFSRLKISGTSGNDVSTALVRALVNTIVNS